MHIPDGSHIDYDGYRDYKRPCIFSWGWIGYSVPLSSHYLTDDIRKSLVNKFKQFIDPENQNRKYVVNHYMGHHTCEICGEDNFYWNGSIKILHDGKIYNSPAGVSHYIEKHNYTPPKRVLKAIKEGIFLTEKEWEEFNKKDKKYKEEITKRHNKYVYEEIKESILEKRREIEAKKKAQQKIDRINSHMNSGNELSKQLKNIFLRDTDLFKDKNIS